jgi:hypothetical protein
LNLLEGKAKGLRQRCLAHPKHHPAHPHAAANVLINRI